MSDPVLVTPDQVEDLLILVLRERHTEHLAALERRRGMQPQTLERLKTVDHLAALNTQLSGDQHPSVLVGWTGTRTEPEQNEDEAYDVALLIAAEVRVFGQRRRDTLRRRDWTTMTVIECLLQRTPRDGIVSAIRWSDLEALDEGNSERVMSSARIIFEVTVADMVSLAGSPVHDDPNWPPGTPGGPPPDDEPYTPPEQLPSPESFTAEIERTPVT